MAAAKKNASASTVFIQQPEDLRPLLAPALDAILLTLCQQIEAFQHIDPERILVVTAQARGYARASIRGLNGAVVRMAGRRRHYELGLRPLWFRQSSLERRLESLVHELWHIDPAGRGQLDADHRHLSEYKNRDAAALKALTRQALAVLSAKNLAALGHHGEVLMPAWLQRPVLVEAKRSKKNFSDRDLFLQPVLMLSPPGGRSVWW